MTNQQTYNDWNQRLKTCLNPVDEPIAIYFSDEEKVDTPSFRQAVRDEKPAAGCVFWMEAPRQAFSTTREDHDNCSMGSFTHGLLDFQAMATAPDIQAVMETGWLTETAASSIPSVKKTPRHIIYSPLASAERVHVIFLRINAQAAMHLQDALPNLGIEGKPQCHIVAIAKEQNRPAISLGCALSRLRTGMKPEEMTCAIPAEQTEAILKKLENTAHQHQSIKPLA